MKNLFLTRIMISIIFLIKLIKNTRKFNILKFKSSIYENFLNWKLFSINVQPCWWQQKIVNFKVKYMTLFHFKKVKKKTQMKKLKYFSILNPNAISTIEVEVKYSCWTPLRNGKFIWHQHIIRTVYQYCNKYSHLLEELIIII